MNTERLAELYDLPEHFDRLSGTSGSTWECDYCGSTVAGADLKCTACNAPQRARVRQDSGEGTNEYFYPGGVTARPRASYYY